MNATWYSQTSELITLMVYVQPGSKHNEIVGLHNNAVKIKLDSPSIEGKANAALLKFVAELFDVSRSHVTLKRGDKSRYKTLEIRNSKANPQNLI